MLSSIVAIITPIISCFQLIPQLYKTYITKKVKDLSIYTLILILITNLLWLLHGYFIFDYSLIFAGTISCFISILLIAMFFKYKR